MRIRPVLEARQSLFSSPPVCALQDSIACVSGSNPLLWCSPETISAWSAFMEQLQTNWKLGSVSGFSGQRY